MMPRHTQKNESHPLLTFTRSLCFLLITFLSGCASKHTHLYESHPGFYSYISGDVHTDRLDEEYASEVYATPASCQKVITALIALKTLGPDYTYKTSLSVVQKGNLIHEAVLTFSGDPTLTSEHLTALLTLLKDKTIQGALYLDATYFKVPVYSQNLMVDDIGTSYATPVSSINIDGNLITLTFFPGKKGRAALVTTHPRWRINSEVITRENNTRVNVQWKDGTLCATGFMDYKAPALSLRISTQDHDSYVIKKVQEVFSALNIKGKIKLIKQRDPQFDALHTEPVHTIHSIPLSEMIKPALKSSHNLVFDSLYLSILTTSSPKEITDWTQGSALMKELIQTHFGIDSGRAKCVDGSGLSRYNRIQPRILFDLLKKGFEIPEFVDALAKVGEDKSTLKRRSRLSSNIVAKTGNMSGVSCLCGYHLKAKRPKAFVFMSHSFSASPRQIFDLMDSFVSDNM